MPVNESDPFALDPKLINGHTEDEYIDEIKRLRALLSTRRKWEEL